MKSTKKIGATLASLGLLLTLSACGSRSKVETSGNTDPAKSVAIVTDTGGIDDRSFNQSAWEGLQQWGKEHDLRKGIGGYEYIQSSDASDYTNNMNKAVQANFHTIFGVGYKLATAVQSAASLNPKTNFVIIDGVVPNMKNVASATFADNEAAYLAGIAAGYTTKTNKVGFIGGEEGEVIDRFQAGFTAGVKQAAKQLHKKIKVDVQYAASFSSPDKGKAIAANMYESGIDIIYHAAGGTGAGVFQEAKSLNQSNPDKKVWVIGVDSDQSAEGEYKASNGKKECCTLTSTIKGVNEAVLQISNDAWNNHFPGGKVLSFGLKDKGVSITRGEMTETTWKAVQAAKQAVIDGKVSVPSKT